MRMVVVKISLYLFTQRRQQNVKINNTDGLFHIFLSGVPLDSILGVIFFNIVINDLFLLVRTADIHNFADNNTISSILDNLEKFISNLKRASEVVINWFRNNIMIFKPSKLQSIIIDHRKTNYNLQTFNINEKELKSHLLNLEIDSRLNFEKHTSATCNNAAKQLNALLSLKSL